MTKSSGILAIILILAVIAGCVGGKKALSSLSRPKKPVKRDLQENLKFSACLTKENAVKLRWELENFDKSNLEKITIYRSVEDLDRAPLNLTLFSITVLPVKSPAMKGSITDTKIADGVTYHYLAEVATKHGSPHFSRVVSVKTPSKILSDLKNPWIHIDKINYLLEIIDGGTTVKRYPVSLGKDPFHRKLHQDNATTPEGIYRIVNLQPRATYYRAYDINYPRR